MKYYVFPKLFQHLTMEEMLETCAELEISGPTCMVRDGYWVTDENKNTMLPVLVREAEKRELEIKYADTVFSMSDIATYENDIRLLKENGITQFRLGYVYKFGDIPLRDLADTVRRTAAQTAEIAERIGIKAVIQLHGLMYPHNATAAYPIVKDLNPDYIGIKIDPGNNIAVEGYELFEYQIPLLSEYVAAIGAKDACMMRKGNSKAENKGWERMFVPAFEGAINYPEIFKELKKISFDGPLILMPFYDGDDFNRLLKNLKREISYFKKIERELM